LAAIRAVEWRGMAKSIQSMVKPIHIGVGLAIPLEIANDFIGLLCTSSLKGPTEADMTPLKIFFRKEVWIMHLPGVSLVDLLHDDSIVPGLLLRVGVLLFSGYLDWVLLITVLIYAVRAAARYVQQLPSG
jgi:hypothetical protein